MRSDILRKGPGFSREGEISRV